MTVLNVRYLIVYILVERKGSHTPKIYLFEVIKNHPLGLVKCINLELLTKYGTPSFPNPLLAMDIRSAIFV